MISIGLSRAGAGILSSAPVGREAVAQSMSILVLVETLTTPSPLPLCHHEQCPLSFCIRQALATQLTGQKIQSGLPLAEKCLRNEFHGVHWVWRRSSWSAES